MKALLCCLLFAFLFFSSPGYSQSSDSSKVVQKDLWDIVSPKKVESIEDEEAHKIQKGLLPYASINPATGVEFGVFGNLAAYFGDHTTTRLSNMTMGAAYTTKKQFTTNLRTIIFTNNDNWILVGDARFYKYSQSTYGLGSASTGNAEVPLTFNMIRFYETALRKIYKSLYAGGGINYQRHYSIGGYTPVDVTEGVPVSYDAYSLYCFNHDFNPNEYTSAGLNLSAGIDSRDNIINAYKGIYFRTSYFFYDKVLGGSSKWQSIGTEFKTYLPLAKKHNQRLAFWYYGSFLTNGRAPYMELPSIGWDTYGNSGRGYVQGRFRGSSMVYAETEYRLDLSTNGLLGAVAFLNCSTTSNDDTAEHLFNTMNPAGGLGLRIKLNKISRTNISIDYGIGKNSNGFYLNVGEAF
ncbi:outer membrane protein assembly factor [Solitalea sp. MAHUQ-68]|uniref:Outer membrane protein assembly factor n=1 Tax=Solitalea agri TaxID=2953739 RepID=A0A9X2F3B6_9SPHI|nr:BamA/TamA family outer membrane protein [Solitalea agri]MCO4293972.1 outer membrane protein assembly factor [Solitalea agri]